jgi:hypothetical protein
LLKCNMDISAAKVAYNGVFGTERNGIWLWKFFNQKF